MTLRGTDFRVLAQQGFGVSITNWQQTMTLAGASFERLGCVQGCSSACSAVAVVLIAFTVLLAL